jgi:hypothetical protein
LAHWEATHKGEVPKVYYLSTYNDRVILSWRMITNQVWKDADGEWKEKQEIEVTYENGEKQVLPYVEFITKTGKIPARLVSTFQKGGQTIFEVEAGNKKYKIDSTFVN